MIAGRTLLFSIHRNDIELMEFKPQDRLHALGCDVAARQQPFDCVITFRRQQEI
jgi:hypothetical protein